MIGAVGTIALLAALTNQRTPVKTLTVTRKPVRRVLEEDGKTRLPTVYRVTMPLPGYLHPMTLVEGDIVSSNQVLARVDEKDWIDKVTAARARVQRLEAAIRESDDERIEQTGLKQVARVLESLDRAIDSARQKLQASLARQDYGETAAQRVRDLFAKRSASQQELDEAELRGIESRVDYQSDQLTLQASEAIRAAMKYLPISLQQNIEKKLLRRAVLEQEKREADAALALAERELDRTNIAAPCTGVILRREVAGAVYLPVGAVLLELGNIQQLEIEAEILSQEVTLVRTGSPVEVEVEPLGILPAVVQRVYPRGFTKISSLGVEQQRVKVIIGWEPAARERLQTLTSPLGIDYRLRLRIVVAEKPNVVAVPRAVVFRGANDTWWTYRLSQGRAEKTVVTLGLQGTDDVEILEGLEVNDEVILPPDTDFRPGQRVQPIR